MCHNCAGFECTFPAGSRSGRRGSTGISRGLPPSDQSTDVPPFYRAPSLPASAHVTAAGRRPGRRRGGQSGAHAECRARRSPLSPLSVTCQRSGAGGRYSGRYGRWLHRPARGRPALWGHAPAGRPGGPAVVRDRTSPATRAGAYTEESEPAGANRGGEAGKCERRRAACQRQPTDV